jgi:hypothetical protein
MPKTSTPLKRLGVAVLEALPLVVLAGTFLTALTIVLADIMPSLTESTGQLQLWFVQERP